MLLSEHARHAPVTAEQKFNSAVIAFKNNSACTHYVSGATGASEVEKAVSFAVYLDARISTMACIVKVRAPSQHVLSDAFVAELVASEMKKISDVAAELLAALEASAEKAGVFQESL